MASFVGVAFFDGAGGGGMVGEVVLEPAVEAIGSSPATRAAASGGGRLDDQANFLYRQQQLAAGLVFAAQTVKHVAIEQAPKIKTFIGTSANAAKTQIGTALVYMLLRYPHLRSRFGWCLSNVVVLINLFTHRDLHA